jgi:hypothetical protein
VNARSYGGAVAEIEPGRNTEVTIDVAQPPEFVAAEVPISGTIEIPAAWGAPQEMFLECIDKGIVEEKTIHIGNLPLELAEPRTFRFSTSTHSLGLWSADAWAGNEARFGCDFVVGPEGATDLFFAIGEPAELCLVYRDASSGEPRPLPKETYVRMDWTSSGAACSAWGDSDSDESTGWVRRVPIGPISVRSECSGYAPVTERFRVEPGMNEHVICLVLPVGVEVRFTVQGEAVSPESADFPIGVRSLDGNGSVVDTREDYTLYEVYVAHPGRYELTVLPLDGYLPVRPIEVDLQPGKLRRVEIPLTPRK